MWKRRKDPISLNKKRSCYLKKSRRETRNSWIKDLGIPIDEGETEDLKTSGELGSVVSCLSHEHRLNSKLHAPYNWRHEG